MGLLLVQIVVILTLCRGLRVIIVRLGQPAVIGEILAGLLLGPSFFGWIAPSWYAHLFVPSSLPLLNALSQVGLVIFMFLVGLRLDLTEVYNLRSAATSTALLSIILPFSAVLFYRASYALSPRHPRRVCHSLCLSAFP